jgi:ABC-type methionine transport system ATPase subunit
MMIATYETGFVRKLTDWVACVEQGMILEVGKLDLPTQERTHAFLASVRKHRPLMRGRDVAKSKARNSRRSATVIWLRSSSQYEPEVAENSSTRHGRPNRIC